MKCRCIVCFGARAFITPLFPFPLCIETTVIMRAISANLMSLLLIIHLYGGARWRNAAQIFTFISTKRATFGSVRDRAEQITEQRIDCKWMVQSLHF